MKHITEITKFPNHKQRQINTLLISQETPYQLTVQLLAGTFFVLIS